jgi:hypothetical protein
VKLLLKLFHLMLQRLDAASLRGELAQQKGRNTCIGGIHGGLHLGQRMKQTAKHALYPDSENARHTPIGLNRQIAQIVCSMEMSCVSRDCVLDGKRG